MCSPHAMSSGCCIETHLGSSISRAGLILLTLIFLAPPLGDARPSWKSCNDNNGYFALGSTYQSNIGLLSKELEKAARSASGFAIASRGSLPDIVHAMILCRGDVNSTACRACVEAAFFDAQQLCPYFRDSAVYYDTCYMRFSNENFINSTDNDDVYVHEAEVLEMSVLVSRVFSTSVALLFQKTIRYAALSSAKLFATSEMAFSGSSDNATIYGLAQCTPDLSQADCLRCLNSLSTLMPHTFRERSITIQGTRCMFCYSVIPFFSGRPTLQLHGVSPALTPAPPPVSVTPRGAVDSGGKHTVRKVLVVSVTLAVTLLVIVLLLFAVWIWNNRKAQQPAQVANNGDEDEEFGGMVYPQYTLIALQSATQNFAEQNKLGEGAFGPVYKGKLDNGQDIAVKRLSKALGQGLKELKNEVTLITKLQHKNLVRLLGHCIEGRECLLVYEFLCNKSLDTLLYDTPRHQKLTWIQRYKIIDGISRGIMYLHQDSIFKIIHRDLKPSNILVDGDMNPKISDFGLAKLLDMSVAHTVHPVGTYGYMAPEFYGQGIFSCKSDVFSYGVIVLEVVTGMRPSHNLIMTVWSHWIQGNVQLLLNECSDADEFGRQVMLRCIHVGLLCVQDNPDLRPRMREVLTLLSNYNVTLVPPTEPTSITGNRRREAAPETLSGVAAPETSINEASVSLEPR